MFYFATEERLFNVTKLVVTVHVTVQQKTNQFVVQTQLHTTMNVKLSASELVSYLRFTKTKLYYDYSVCVL